jgi:glycerophosphoryl diester phosphodiesterase
VCRHAQCDLHRTTDILTRPELAKKCSVPFTPANPDTNKPAMARCCTSDISMSEFLSLRGKMDGANPQATDIESFMDGTANWRTDLYAATGTLMSFADSIDLFQALQVKMTPELKAPEVAMPFGGNFTQADYAESAVQLLLQKNIKPEQVYLQSFSWPDIQYWLKHHPNFGKQAVFLDDRADEPDQLKQAIESLPDLKAQGLNIVAPPLWVLLSVDADNKIVPSNYAKAAKQAGLNIITWSLERSGYISQQEDYYYSSIQSAITSEGDIYRVLDVLHKDLGVLGVFSDWPAAVTYYANCMGIE